MQSRENPKPVAENKQNVQNANRNYLNDWKSISLNIGIFGDSTDDAKKFLIDRLTSYGEKLISLDPRVSVYQHKNNHNIQVWDLNPEKEINEQNFQYYISNVNLDSFDVFILFRKNTFSEFDYQ